MKPNIELLKKLRTRFLRMRHPKHFNMKVIAAKTDCGAAMCLIGHTLEVAGFKMCISNRRDGFLDFDFISPNGHMVVDAGALELPRNKTKVFATPMEFREHHEQEDV